MKGYQIFATCTLGLLVQGFAFPMETMARPKGSAANCNTKDLNTNFGASCNDQMQQDVINNKPYTHVLVCGGETMLCCTVDNSTGQVQTCRKPAGARVMPGLNGTNIGAAGTAGIQRRGVEGGDPADEEAPIPSSLTPDVAKQLLKDSK